MISVDALAMRGMNGGGGAAHQDGAGQEGLQMAFGGQQPLPVRQILGYQFSLFRRRHRLAALRHEGRERREGFRQREIIE